MKGKFTEFWVYSTGEIRLHFVNSTVWVVLSDLSMDYYNMNDIIIPKLKVKNSKKAGANIYFIE